VYIEAIAPICISPECLFFALNKQSNEPNDPIAVERFAMRGTRAVSFGSCTVEAFAAKACSIESADVESFAGKDVFIEESRNESVSAEWCSRRAVVIFLKSCYTG
jgi:hypothetical protein